MPKVTVAMLAMIVRAAGLAVCLLLAAGASPASLAEDAPLERPEVVAFVDELVDRHGFDRAEIDALLAGARSRPGIIERISKPAERTLTWADYRRIFLGADRIAEGARFVSSHEESLARAERAYGVPPHYVAAILGVETRYGSRRGDWPVLDALYTLAFDYPPRQRFFRAELEQLLLLAREEGRAADTLLGSYAGAMGWGQFIPSSYRHYAVDFDGDGVRDIWDDPVDAIGSVANYFAEHAWRPDGPVLRRVSVVGDADLEGVVNTGLDLRHTVGELRALGVTGLDGLDASEAAGLWRVQGPAGEELYVTFGNFRTITRYNHSHLYALAVHDLATAIDAARSVSPKAPGSSP